MILALVLSYLAVGLTVGVVFVRRYPTWDPITDGLMLFAVTLGWGAMAVGGAITLPFVGLARLVNRNQ